MVFRFLNQYSCISTYKHDLYILNIQSVGSLFKDNDLLKVDFAIPVHASKQEIQALRGAVNNLYDEDDGALEDFYDTQLRILDEKLAKM